jgi:hypothetical protein
VSLKVELNGTRHNMKPTHNTRLTPRSGEVQEADAEEWGSAKS